MTRQIVATYSIVACDLHANEWGVCTQSKFLAVGSVVPWAQAGVGAIATQAWANVSYGPRGLELLVQGKSAAEVIDELVSSDDGGEHRQLGIVDGNGRAAAFTGAECLDWAGHVVGDGFCCQGNILVDGNTVDAMAAAYERSEGRLADRLIQALAAAQAAGGDRRGQQSAAILVVKPDGSYGGYTDRYIDLRVDEHERPVEELQRVLNLFYLYFERGLDDDAIDIEGQVASDISCSLKRLDYYNGDQVDELTPALRQALDVFYRTENFEMRMRDDDKIDRSVFEFMKRK